MEEDLFDVLVSLDVLEYAYMGTQEGERKYDPNSIIFSQDLTRNLIQLQHELMSETYTVSGYHVFRVFEPKERLIYAPMFRDKIVQLALYYTLSEVLDRKFIFDSYGCIAGKGTHAAVDRINYFIKHAKYTYGEDTFLLKIDIKQFFYTIDKGILMEIVNHRVKDKRLVRLLHIIVYSIDQEGLPLGNAVSQLLANLYLNEVDQYAKHVLGIKYYVRYMDDIVIVCENVEQSRYYLNELSSYIISRLNIEPNENKTKSFPLNQGINTIGYRIFSTHILLRSESISRIKQKIKKIEYLLINGEITKEKAEQIFNSWLGHAQYASSYNLIQHIVNKYNYIRYNEMKGRLEII